MKANVGLIQLGIEENTNAPPTRKDLHNLKQSMQRNEEKSVLESLLKEFSKLDENVVKVFANGNEVEAIFFQDDRMRTYFELYPEVLLVDSTYKLNDRSMPVMILLVVDGNNESQIVGFSVIKTESYETILQMLKYFINDNPNVNQLKVVLTDKSSAERKAIRKAFPKANLQICIFHALQIFKREITCKKRNITNEEKNEILSLLRKMIFSKEKYEYKNAYAELMKMNCPLVTEYFNKHWHDICHEWVGCYTNENYNMFNRTTNRVESLNQKLKDVVTRNGKIDTFAIELLQCIESLNVEKDHRNISSISRQPINSFAPKSVEQKYKELLTEFAFKKVLVELECIDSFKIQKVGQNHLYYQSNKNIHITFEKKCECRFFTSMELPCRHILKLMQIKKQSRYCPEICKSRWLKEYLPSKETILGIRKKNVLSGSEKYARAMKKFEIICNSLSMKTQAEFDAYMEIFTKVENCVQNDEPFAVIPTTINKINGKFIQNFKFISTY